ncbi:Fumarylacetoacetate hydrolase family protein [Rhodovastum atsumiense]|uniref:Fumarylacetoacetate hydrolase family protein n=1 Tax=Rhodovastum atsumiense TaxID=504468 RepID=A0A5M6IVC3_9PROT|nr:fumarylacetoacetate hydrolase family protein [Rhodovastum atsumiense]KAA5612256.1 fumarylacetoacetate hydrolase family protein [Rhodovastum atsumiense]CAH2601579.1 Fumarylacetoacetate hydrolase family protein [Rhodovastum atsumiense]
MQFATLGIGDRQAIAVPGSDGRVRGRFIDDPACPGSLESLVAGGAEALAAAGRALAAAPEINEAEAVFLPPLRAPGKIICVGLNYAAHSAESGFTPPSYPTIFARFASSLVGHGAPIIRPRQSDQLDFEGEFVAVIGRAGRDIPRHSALDHVVGYSLFNDASIRDYQFRTPQWTVGKTFDATGAFGPWLVTADTLPPGCAGLRLQTRLNGETVQDASTDDLIFDVATLVSLLSEVCTLECGDIIVTGTPAGVGFARKPPLWMQPGDVCEVAMEGLGTLRNGVTAATG